MLGWTARPAAITLPDTARSLIDNNLVQRVVRFVRAAHLMPDPGPQDSGTFRPQLAYGAIQQASHEFFPTKPARNMRGTQRRLRLRTFSLVGETED